jgi:hypothetical protein
MEPEMSRSPAAGGSAGWRARSRPRSRILGTASAREQRKTAGGIAAASRSRRSGIARVRSRGRREALLLEQLHLVAPRGPEDSFLNLGEGWWFRPALRKASNAL